MACEVTDSSSCNRREWRRSRPGRAPPHGVDPGEPHRCGCFGFRAWIRAHFKLTGDRSGRVCGYTKHWHDEAPAVDQGDEAARWFSEFLGTACRLMAKRRGSTIDRFPKSTATSFPRSSVVLAAVAPILLTSEASLADLNGRIAKPIRMNRFRQNLVVEGSAPFHEEWWARVRIGGPGVRKGGFQRALQRNAVESRNCRAGYRADPHARKISPAARRCQTVASCLESTFDHSHQVSCASATKSAPSKYKTGTSRTIARPSSPNATCRHPRAISDRCRVSGSLADILSQHVDSHRSSGRG